MQKTKKLLSLLLAVAMLFSLAVPSVFAADFSDVPESYQYYDSVQSLVARGIINGYDDGTFKPEGNITRGEFAKMIIYALGLSDLAATPVTETGFPDVAPEHWAASVIKIAHDMGIINGFDDGTFKPDENVTYDQALKMTICAKYDRLGEIALKNGGYPSGYRKVANSYGFIKGITDGVYESAAMRGTIAKLIYNMLNIDLSKYTDDTTIVDPTNQSTEVKGQVVAVYGASLESTVSSLTKYQLKIEMTNGAVITYSGENLSNKDNLRSYLGKMVVGYYTEAMGVEIQALSSLDLQRGKNGEVTVDMADVSASSTDTKLTYTDEDGDTEDISVSSNAKILYNGSLVPSGTTFSSLIAANRNSSGSIRLLSTEGSGNAADVIFFTVYTNYLVTSTNSSTKTVYLDDGSAVTQKVIDEDSKTKTVTITKDGSSVGFSSISKNTILSISEDLSGNFMEVLIGPAAISGKVSAMTRDEGKITVSSKEYKFASGVTFGTDISVGSNLKIYLDAFGKIAKYEFVAASTTYTYGYLTQIKNVGSSVSADIRVEMVDLKSTSLKSFTNYALADSVQINGTTYKTATDFSTIESVLAAAAQQYIYTESGKSFGAGSGEIYQPVKYTLSNGKISTMLVGKAGATEADLRVDASTLDTTTYSQGIKCTTKYTGLAGIYTLSSSTKVLYINDSSDRSINAYTLKTGTNSGLALNSYYRVLLVDTSSAGTPALVVVYNIGGSDVNATTNDWVSALPMVVTNKGSDAEYNNITVQTYNGSSAVVYHDEGTSFFDQVEKGDIVRITADSDKVIEAMEVVAKATEIYNGSGFVKVSSRQSTASGINFIDKSTGNDYARLIREGDLYTSDNAALSIMAGTVYSVVDSTFKIALDYAGDTTTGWTEIGLGNDEHLKSMKVSDSTKVVTVRFNTGGNVQSIDTTETVGSLIPYMASESSSANTDASRVFVYRSGSSARMIVVYRSISE